MIPRKEIDDLAPRLNYILKELDPGLEGEILGSYRRGLKSSSDVDFVVRHPAFDTHPMKYPRGSPEDKEASAISRAMLQKVIGAIREAGIIPEEPLLDGDKRVRVCRTIVSSIFTDVGVRQWAGFWKLPGSQYKHVRRLDVRLVPYQSYAYVQNPKGPFACADTLSG